MGSTYLLMLLEFPRNAGDVNSPKRLQGFDLSFTLLTFAYKTFDLQELAHVSG